MIVGRVLTNTVYIVLFALLKIVITTKEYYDEMCDMMCGGGDE